MSKSLDQQAIDILQTNDRGGFTIPTARLYPYQWNWDSAFVALGFATFDRARAWRELELLLEGQWSDGMIPHILFRRDDPDYFPGPSVWGTTEGKMPTGGHSQPPVLASVVRTLVEADAGTEARNSPDADDDTRGAALFDAMLRWHRWFHTERTPEGCPVVATVHPWETGRDNCPDWDIGLGNMAVDATLEPFQRRDTDHADPAQRPSQEQYDKYLSIVHFGRSVQWDQTRLTNEGPFLMADPGIHFILLRADRDLLALARRWQRTQAIAEIESWIQAAEQGSDYFWNDSLGAFTARDIRSGVFSNGFSNASPLCFYADAGSATQRERTIEHLQRVRSACRFMLPSWDPQAPRFEAQRYWCGPLWPQMNYLVARGLAEQDHTQMAERLRDDLRAVIEKSGFYECFDPISGQGCIGTDFSWTAAMWLAWATPGEQ